MIDIDLFKPINEAYRHKVGDMVLCEVAATIRQSAPGNALVCRYGGEEFCVVLPDTPIELATELAEQTRQQVARQQIT